MYRISESEFRNESGKPGALSQGFTLVELMLAVALLSVLAAMAMPVYEEALEAARVAHAIGDIKAIEKDILSDELLRGRLAGSLGGATQNNLLDPWGNSYRYLNFGAAGKGAKGQMRKDKNLVPINTRFDLYSMGKDGGSLPPLTAKISRDDIVRGSDGAFVGLASDY